MIPSPAGASRPAHDDPWPREARAAALSDTLDNADAPDGAAAPPTARSEPALLELCLGELLASLPPPASLDPGSEAGWEADCAQQLVGLAPRDALEGMMAVQMVALHRSGLRSLRTALLPEAVRPEQAASAEGWPPRLIAPGAAAAARDRGLARAGQAFALFGRLATQLARKREGPERRVTIVHLRQGPDREAEREAEAEALRREQAEVAQDIVRRIAADVAACRRPDEAEGPEGADGKAAEADGSPPSDSGTDQPAAAAFPAEVLPWEDPDRTPEERAIAGLFERHFPHSRHHAAAVAAGIGDDGVPVLGAEADALVAALGARFKQRPPDEGALGDDGPDADAPRAGSGDGP